MTELDPRIQELLDKEAIRDAITWYARGVDRGDAEIANQAYHVDAVDERGHETLDRDIGAHMVESMLKSMAMTTHHLTTQTIVIDGDTAGAETYSLGVHRPVFNGQEKRMLSSGRYIDRLERRDGTWRITHRRLITDMVRMMSLDDEIDIGPSTGRRDHDDISYEVLGG